MSSPLPRDDVAHVARLARLALTDDELELFADQLGDILEHAADVEGLDLSGIEPMSHPIPLTNVLRTDAVVGSLDRETVLAEAPNAQDGQFRVPPVLGEL